jgi:hypothetical protein
MAGVGLITGKELMGHKHLAMTLCYAYPALDHERLAVEVLSTGM